MNQAQAIRDVEGVWKESVSPILHGWIAQVEAQQRYQERLVVYLAQPLGALNPRARAGLAEYGPLPSKSHDLIAYLRRLSGLNPRISRRHYRRDEWSDCSEGRVGLRSCPPAQWDNAIRALEEDR